MPVYPGFPGPRIGAYMTHEESLPHYAGRARFHVSRYDLVGSLGTYLDSPFHRHPEEADLSRLPLERVACLPGLVVDARGTPGRALEPGLLAGRRVRGRAVLFWADWSARWGSPAYFEPAPYLSVEVCRLLVARGAALVGVDFWNVDDTSDPSRPAHTTLLAAGVPIVENLAHLDRLPASGFRFHAAPLGIVGGASVPVRAYARIET